MRRKGVRRAARVALIGGGVTAASAVLGVVGERYLMRRERSKPDPERDEPLGERPGTEIRVRSFDGTDLAVNVVGPTAARRPRATVVLVHGFSADMTVWHYQWKRLSAEYRCVLFDQRGHGRSAPAVAGNYSLEALARDLRAVVDETAPRGPVALVGHSMGGMTVLSFAKVFPEEFGARVSAAVLASTAAADLVKSMLGGLGIHAGKTLALAAAGARRLVSDRRRAYRIRARALAGRGDLAYLVARATNFGPNAPPSLVDYVARLGARAPVEVWTDLVGSLIDMDLIDALDRIACPSLVVVGDVDRLTPQASAVALARRLPDAELVVLEGAGHCAMLELHEEFNSAVEGFLRRAVRRQPQRAPA
jgi:pimeloyl-ACP methyl ester carboxylesterase